MPNVKICGYLCKTNIASNTCFRSSGAPQVSIITEDMIDRLAGKLNMNPHEVRKIISCDTLLFVTTCVIEDDFHTKVRRVNLLFLLGVGS